MGKFVDFSTSKDILAQINKITSNSSLEKEKKAIQELFVQTTSENCDWFIANEDNNVTSGQKTKMQANEELLKSKLQEYEEELKKIEDEIEPLQAQISAKSDDIADCINEIAKKTTEWEEQQQENVNTVVHEFLYNNLHPDWTENQYRSNLGIAIEERLNNFPSVALGRLKSQLTNDKSQISTLVGQVSNLIDQRQLKIQQYDTTKAAHDVIAGVLEKVGNTDTNYENSNYDSKVPTYSPTKVITVADLTKDYKTDSGISKKTGTSSNSTNYNNKLATLQGLTNADGTSKYSSVFAKKDGLDSGDGAGLISAPANQLLKEAIDNGLIDDLNSSGFTSSEKAEFFATYFAGSGFKYDATSNEFSAQYGDASTFILFQKVESCVKNDENSSSKYVDPENTWNTISNNNQLKELSENDNYETILSDLYNQNFTFKEAMYALFDEDNGLFKDTGIVYDLNKQNADGEVYSIISAGDEETLDLYKNIAESIKEKWGVGNAILDNTSSITTDIARIDTAETTEKETTGTEEIRTKDPISFEKDGMQYSFIIDRDNSGSFNDTNEFVGALDKNDGKSTTWLQDLLSFDTDGDGILSGSELENVKLAGTKFSDEDKKGIQDGINTVDIEYAITDAKSLGIESIDLNGLKTGQTSNEKDVNGSVLYEDGFTIKYSNGTTADATRKDDTETYLDTVYGDMTSANGKSFNVNLTENEFSKILDEAFSVTSASGQVPGTTKDDQYYKDLETSIKSLKNLDTEYEYLNTETTNAQNRVKSYIKAKKVEANSQFGDKLGAGDATVESIKKATQNSKDIMDVMGKAMKEGVALTSDEAQEFVDNINNGKTFEECLEEYKDDMTKDNK